LIRFDSNGLPQPPQLGSVRRDRRLRRAAAFNAAASHSVEQQNSFGGRLFRLAMIGRPQWTHGDRGHHALLSGKPWSGKNSGGLTLHAAQTRMMVPGHFLYAQS
jgi:hypothetical protein